MRIKRPQRVVRVAVPLYIANLPLAQEGDHGQRDVRRARGAKPYDLSIGIIIALCRVQRQRQNKLAIANPGGNPLVLVWRFVCGGKNADTARNSDAVI